MVMTFSRRSALNQRFETLGNQRFLRALFGIGDSKVSNLKMDTDYTEKNPFADGAANPGYDETGEINEMDRFPSSSSRRGSEDHRTYEETSFTTGGDISEITPLITEEEERDKALAKKREEEEENQNKAWAEIKRKFPNSRHY